MFNWRARKTSVARGSAVNSGSDGRLGRRPLHSPHSARPPNRRVALVCALCLACASCGREDSGRVPVYPATGLITWNGEPLAGALLVFHPTTALSGADDEPVPIPGANSQEDGSFAVSTYLPGDGLPEGDYQVTVSCEDRRAEKPKDDDYPELLPSRYQNPTTSGLSVSIVPGENELPAFELTP